MLSDQVTAAARDLPSKNARNHDAAADGSPRLGSGADLEATGGDSLPENVRQNTRPNKSDPFTQGLDENAQEHQRVHAPAQARRVKSPLAETAGGVALFGPAALFSAPDEELERGWRPRPRRVRWHTVLRKRMRYFRWRRHIVPPHSEVEWIQVKGSGGGTQPVGQTLPTRKTLQRAHGTGPVVSRVHPLTLGQGTSTIANRNFKGVLLDLMNKVAPVSRATKSSNPRDLAALRHRFHAGRLIRFHDRAEVRAVRPVVDSSPKGFKRIPEGVRRSLISKLALGEHDPDGLLQGKEKYKQDVLNHVAKATLMNSTYLAKDSERFLKKVRSLLPASANARQAQKSKPDAQR